MEEKTLLKLALICSLVGIIALFFISERIEIKEKNINEINKDNIGEDVRIKGIVSRSTDNGKIILLDIVQPETITIVLFKDTDFNISTGTKVEIIGEIDEFNGKMEIIGNEVNILS
ncbi:hypothetical protein COY26_03255 [Candidatus Woesearchaeota archaeon CG_4_10_14_0_2_um_filter_33_10]|nr:MAG: hypothetical protein AUJ83_02750 [Candidatus Woesearchaeota archaeon CG1_02_33_12]PIN77823.1 MAG: hypothetical protein COV14_05010 [Candidatus Woesearchaeota archaeon CG10_big_fil_rev_8_21_14_0_10_33_12]PIU72971.1 MAG: hypothetical protein COS79_00435 [Candidatus Woesearchaeota archaeon CG06_land_8_20_14_3_00_33_13]PIZ52917.1 MAG: hypothetical protein COY26_03255 [Candidatus Woesearchaeota archaeon CG_4_10_14_0_2_um_filter_33_10]